MLTAWAAWLILVFDIAFVDFFYLNLIANCPDFMRDSRVVVLILVNDKLTYIKLFGKLEYVNDILPTLVLLIFFELGRNMEKYQKKLL